MQPYGHQDILNNLTANTQTLQHGYAFSSVDSLEGLAQFGYVDSLEGMAQFECSVDKSRRDGTVGM